MYRVNPSRRTLIGCIFILFLFIVPPIVSVDAGNQGYIVVKLSDAEIAIADINARFNTYTVDDHLSDRGIYLLRPNHSAPRTVRSLNDDARVEYAELNHNEIMLSEAVHANPSHIWAWGITSDSASLNTHATRDNLQLSDVHRLATGTGTMVAVIDTGVQIDHPYFYGKVTTGYDFVDGDNDPSEEINAADIPEANRIAGHGTHVAGLVHMMAPGATILPIRALAADGSGDLFAVVDAIVYAVDRGADVINLSLGTETESQFLRDAVDYATQNGVVVVAAAGNQGTSAKQYPAAYSNVIAVGSVDSSLNKSSFSNYGKWVDVVAYGEDSFNAYLVDSYAWWSGTSMATALVSGNAALIAGVNDDVDAGQMVLNAAQSIKARNKLGRGIIDPLNSLASFELSPIFEHSAD